MQRLHDMAKEKQRFVRISAFQIYACALYCNQGDETEQDGLPHFTGRTYYIKINCSEIFKQMKGIDSAGRITYETASLRMSKRR